jgi:hypothetical protein
MGYKVDASDVRPPISLSLGAYWRAFKPDLEAGPREPVYAVGLVSPKGVPFVLVREAIGADHVGQMIACFLWRDSACVGFLGATLTGDPFGGGAPLRSRRGLDVKRTVAIWRSHITTGGGGESKECLHDFARLPSRGLGLAFASYVEIVRQLSVHGWALRSKPSARNSYANALWHRLRATTGIEVVRRMELTRFRGEAASWDVTLPRRR